MIRLIDAPGNLGLKRPGPEREPGVRFAPWQLRQLHLEARLGAICGGSLEPPIYTGIRDPETLILHSAEIAAYSNALSVRVEEVLDAGDFPLILGGDCSVLLGPLLALKRRGRHGLLFVDGHRDLMLPQQTRHGAAAGMDLALALGHGPFGLAKLDPDGPLLRAEDVIPFGYRDDDSWYSPALIAQCEGAMRGASLDAARSEEIPRALRRRLDALLAEPVAGFFIHLDVDVLDSEAMFAIDAPQPGGMTVDELVETLTTAVASGRALGMLVSNFDPERDRQHQCAMRLVDALARGLAPLFADTVEGGTRAVDGTVTPDPHAVEP